MRYRSSFEYEAVIIVYRFADHANITRIWHSLLFTPSVDDREGNERGLERKQV